MRKYFGTDGVRGKANLTLTPEFVFRLGRAGAYRLSKGRDLKDNKFIIIGKDTRISGDMLESALMAGICSVGINVWKIGVSPTPTIAWLTRYYNKALAGVVISASHNPAPDNGIKFFSNTGQKLDDEIENEIENIIDNEFDTIPFPIGADIGRIYSKEEIIETYFNEVLKISQNDLSGIKVLLDTSHGATYNIAPRILKALGVKVNVINNKPDGLNINDKCGSTHLESLRNHIKNSNYDIGMAFDGDGDRIIAMTPDGIKVDGDQIMYICSKYLPNLKNNKTIVGTVMSNLGFEQKIIELGKEFLRANVGDRYVWELMVKTGSLLGGEQSGHIIFPEFNSTGDAIITAIQLLNAIIISKKSLTELIKDMPLYPQKLINVSLKNNIDWENNEKIKETISKVKEKLGNNGRVLVRNSGTEPLIRVMVEGKNENIIKEFVYLIADTIRKESE